MKIITPTKKGILNRAVNKKPPNEVTKIVIIIKSR